MLIHFSAAAGQGQKEKSQQYNSLPLPHLYCAEQLLYYYNHMYFTQQTCWSTKMCRYFAILFMV